MKNIKKICLLIVIFMGVFLLTGCDKNVEGSLEDIMAQVYSDVAEDKRPMMLTNTAINEENIEYFLGTKDIEYTEALASESGVGSIAHSVVLLRTKENADVEKIKDKIENSVNPRKWICVGVEKEDLIVENKGDLVILIMVEDEETREKLENSFEKLK